MKNKVIILILSIVIQLIKIGIVFGKDSYSEANLNVSNSSIGFNGFSQSFTINEIPVEMDLSFLERGKYLLHIVAGSQIIHSEQLIKK